jgi:hypothetical protein
LGIEPILKYLLLLLFLREIKIQDTEREIDREIDREREREDNKVKKTRIT